jgi:peptidoglycan-associated lipoprotein
MRHQRLVLALTTGGLLAALAGGCAAPAKTARPSTEVLDGAAAAAPVSKPEPIAVAPVPAPAPACTLARVHFAFDSAQLEDGAQQELKQAAACLQQRKPAELVIEGHCDERGTAEYNLALGERRAKAAMDYLVSKGVSSDRITIVSFGKERPLCTDSTEACHARNRRDQFLTKER